MAAPLRVCAVCFRYFNRPLSLLRQLHSSPWLASENGVRVRFAPSPTGFLHLGGLRTALYNYLFAKARGGTFILRIEDTDQSRVVAGAVDKLDSILQWTGVVPDEGPSQGGDRGPYIQSQRLGLYQESAKALIENGSAYHCFCSPTRLDILRRDAVQRGETPRYDNRCRHLDPAQVQAKLAENVPHVIRLKLEPTTEPYDDLIKGAVTHNVADIEGDPVLLKTDGYPTYHLANVVDDHHMEVTHVLRGDEWQPSTPKHLLLYKAFGWTPPKFAHLPLIVNKDGTKLSKRQGDIHIEHFKEKGYLPAAVLSYVTTIGGGFDRDTSDLTLDQLVDHFQLHRVKRHSGRLDPLFLEGSNHKHLVRLLNAEDPAPLVTALRDLLREARGERSDESLSQVEALDDGYLLHVLHWALNEDRISKLSDLLQPSLAFLWELPTPDLVQKLIGQHPDLDLLTLVTSCVGAVEGVENFSQECLGRALKKQASMTGMKNKEFMPLMRQVLSGVKEGPPVAEMMTVMGRESTVKRLQHCITLIRSP